MRSYTQLTTVQLYRISAQMQNDARKPKLQESLRPSFNYQPRVGSQSLFFEQDYRSRLTNTPCNAGMRNPVCEFQPRCKTMAEMLEVFWRTWQISGWLRQNTSMQVNHERNCQFLDSQQIRRRKTARAFAPAQETTQTLRSTQRRGQIPN